MKLPISCKEINYEAEICYVEVAYDDYFGHGIEIRISCQIDQI